MPTATILVTDLVRSTELRARIGDEHAERLRRLHDRLSRTAVETHGGVVVKGLGDGVLASFAEASAALASAVAVQHGADAHTLRHPDLPLVLRVGLSAGDVTVDAGDCFGTPVVEATRLCAAAEGGQILAAEVVRLLVKGRGTYLFTSAGEFELKGLPEPVAAVEVAWERQTEIAELPFPKLLITEGGLGFAGRISELEVLRAIWKQAAAGERRSVFIAGEPGVGKTRLAAELARSVHEAAGSVLYGRCQEGLGVPYEPFVEALTFFCEHTPPADLRSRLGRYPGELVRLLPELGDLVPGLDPPLRGEPETEQYRLFQAVSSWLAAAGEATGLLCVVDDLHWAPPPTLRLLAHVLRATAAARLLVVGTFRDTEVGPGQSLAPVLADLRRTAGAERIALDGLSIDELAELLGAGKAPALAATLHEETKGNPFFVGEIVRHGGESGLALGSFPVPEGVRDVIVSRVARLAATTGEVLAVAAVLGRDLELVPLATVAGVDQGDAIDALDEALAARLVEETRAGVYRFGHALVRSALEGTVSATRKASLHLRAADVFEDDVARRAHHLLACAPLGGAIRTASACLAAGDRALAVLADAEAGDWYSQGLDYCEEDQGLRIDLLTGLGEVQRRTGDSAARQTLLDAAWLAAGRSDVPRLVRAAVANRRPRGFNILGHADEDRLEVIGTALDLVGQAPSAERAELLSLQAIELVFTGDHQGALQASDEADVIAARLDDATVRARLGVRRMFACQIPERAVALAKESADLVGLADSTGDPQLRILSRRPTPLLYVGALTEAHRRMAEAMAIADESGRLVLRSRAHFEYAATLDALGDHEEAKRLTEVAFELGQQASWPDARQFYGGRMGLHWSFEGELETLIAAAAQGVVQSPKPVVWQGMWALGLALCGREEELTRLLTEVSDALPRVPVDHFWLVAHWLFATAQGFGTEDRQLAATLYDLLLPYRALHAHYGTGYWGPVEVALAVAARVKGDTETAMNHHEAAAATIEACGAARARALNGYQWARTILARGNDLQRASVLAEETLAYCESKGYTTFVPRTEELLTTISTA